MNPPIPYYGGKKRLAKQLLPLIPKHTTYVEVFGGSGALLFAKDPSPVEVYNDIDSSLVNFYRVLRDDFEEFHRLVELMPYSRVEFYDSVDTLRTECDAVKHALKYFIVARMAFAGNVSSRGWSYDIAYSSRGMSRNVSAQLSAIDRLPEVHARLKRVQIEHRSFEQLIPTYDRPETFFYLDPPYVLSTRTKGYCYEMQDADHQVLVDLLLSVKGKAILSGYDHPIYAPLEHNGWERREFAVKSNANYKMTDTDRVESIWISPSCKEGRRCLIDLSPATANGIAKTSKGRLISSTHATPGRTSNRS